jgi:hypothetical protein
MLVFSLVAIELVAKLPKELTFGPSKPFVGQTHSENALIMPSLSLDLLG